jgi:integrase
MLPSVRDALQNELAFQKETGLCCGYEIEGMSNFIFFNRFYSIHNPQGVNRAIKRICQAYNNEEVINAKREKREPVILPNFSCHHLRHTFCSRLCENETNVKLIQEIMGHKDIQTTLDIYAEITGSKKQEAFDKLADKLDFF